MIEDIFSAESLEVVQLESISKTRSLVKNYHRLWMSIGLMIADLIGVFVPTVAISVIWANTHEKMDLSIYSNLLPFTLIFMIIYLFAGLYPAVGMHPANELKKLTLSTSIGFLILFSVTFWLRNAEWYSRATFGLSWVFSLVTVPLCRDLIRRLGIRLHVWGEPVAIIGSGKNGVEFFRFLSKNPRYGMNPIVLINGNIGQSNPSKLSRPSVLARTASLKNILSKVNTMIVVTNEIAPEYFSKIINGKFLQFHRVIMVPNLQMPSSLWISPMDFGGVLGLEIRQNLLKHDQQLFKRFLDIAIILVFLPFWLPIFMVCSLLVFLDTSKTIIYKQSRLGQKGNLITVYKFRTMVDHADEVLEEFLQEREHLRMEWSQTYKLKQDPRTTRVGRFLRKFSLDELPQLWNVLRGDMSLIGPRPIVNDEIRFYGSHFNLVNQVKPGLTGLWQVSGRNNVGYEDRVALDEYYVRNWSIWLDFYIFLRTAEAIIVGKGAY